MRPESREDAHDADLVARLARRDRHLHDRRQPAQALGRHQRHAARRGDRRGPPRRRRRRPAPRPAPASSPPTWWPSADRGATPKQRMTQVAAGLGLLESAVIDQHFDQRNRYGRLLMIVSQSPQLLGIGVDEDTAAVVTDEGERPGAAGRRPRRRSRSSTPPGSVTNAYEAKRSAPAAGQRRDAARAPRGRGLRPDRRAPWSPQPPARRPRGGRRDRRGAARPAPAGPRHRRRRRLARRRCAGARPAAAPGTSPRPTPGPGPDRTEHAR